MAKKNTGLPETTDTSGESQPIPTSGTSSGTARLEYYGVLQGF